MKDPCTKRRLLIVFPSEHLSYSPTTLNLYNALDGIFEVTILAPAPLWFGQRIERRRVEYVHIPYWVGRLAASINHRLQKYLGWNPQLRRRLNAWYLRRAARRHRGAEAVGVDFTGMWVVQQVFARGQMVSLELDSEDPFFGHVDFSRVESLVIQTQARYDHFFKDSGVPCFLVQNAPVYLQPPPAGPLADPCDLLFCGTAVPGFGIYRCLDFLMRYPEFRLTIQGAVALEVKQRMERDYARLLSEGRITINTTYLEDMAMTDYLSRFVLGFCCYDLSVPGINNFNYLSAPSGKLFAYYAAGVPVVASDIPGLASVREFGTGVLIPEFTPEAMRAAVETVRSERARMSANCLRAAQHFSFDKAARPWIEFLTGKVQS